MRQHIAKRDEGRHAVERNRLVLCGRCNASIDAAGNVFTQIVGNVRLEVPPWQRRYSWDEGNWDTLWQSLDEIRVASGLRKHFMGALVFQLGRRPTGMTMHQRIIDGQQRLVSISLVLAGIRRRLAAYPATERRQREVDTTEALLANPGNNMAERVKLVPYGDDLTAYVACLEQDEIDSSARVAQAYEYFRGTLAPLSESQLVRLRDAIAQRLFFAVVHLTDDDDANRIFRSLNEAGMTLSPTDHIRNSLFMSAGASGDSLYATYWEPLERLLTSDDELLSFLFAEQARAPHSPNTLRKKELHRAYGRVFADMGSRQSVLRDYLDRLHRNGHIFKAIRTPSRLGACGFANHTALESPVTRLNEWSSQPAEISMLDALVRYRDRELQLSQVTRSLHSIESFVVRRFLSGQNANLLSRIFTDLVAQFPESGTYSTRLRAALSHEGHGWPTNREVERSLTSTLNFYAQGSAPQRRFVLKELNAHRIVGSQLRREEIPLDWPRDLTIEHILPQSLSDDWAEVLEAERVAEGWTDSVEELHAAHVNLIGNLTLARQRRNVQYSNRLFDDKVALINEELPIRLNEELGSGPYAAWSVGAIRLRSKALSELACKIWQAPVGR